MGPDAHPTSEQPPGTRLTPPITAIAAGSPARHARGRPYRGRGHGGPGGRPMPGEPDQTTRRSWVGRALGLALIGGLVGWIITDAALLAMLRGMHGLAAPGGPDESDLMLAALVGGAPCGAALGLVAWS